jgi:hypothetical protein
LVFDVLKAPTMSFVHNVRDQPKVEENGTFEIGNKLGENKHILAFDYDKFMIIYFCS